MREPGLSLLSNLASGTWGGKRPAYSEWHLRGDFDKVAADTGEIVAVALNQRRDDPHFRPAGEPRRAVLYLGAVLPELELPSWDSTEGSDRETSE